VADHNGVADGLVVAKHAEEEPRLVLGHVPVPLQLTEDEIVVVLVNNHADVTPVPAKVSLYSYLVFNNFFACGITC